MFDPLKQWRDARQHLDAAIKSYLECLNTLGSDFYSRSRTINAGWLESVTLEVQEDLISMESRHERLREGECALGGILNKSTSIVPISKIPNELFLEILRISAREDTDHGYSYFDSLLCYDQHYSFSKLLILTHVCADWRRTIITTPSFWQYVDMQRHNIFERANAIPCVKILLERSASQPLYFDVMFPPSLGKKDSVGLVPPVAEYLLPHMHRLRSLRLGCYINTAKLVDFFSIWFSMARAPTFPLHTLAIWRHSDFDPDADNTFVYDPTVHPTSHALLLPIRVLRLNRFVFEWTSVVYRNLAHLHIDNLSYEASPSMDEIIDILAACPELQILQLTDMYLNEGERDHQEPVTLHHLKVLNVAYLYGDGVGLLLPLLVVPQTNALSLRLGIFSPQHESSSAALEFLVRANVYRLSIAAARHRDELGKYLSAARNVEILILDLDRNDGEWALTAMMQLPPPLRPRTRTLYLCRGWFEEKSLRDPVERYPSIRKLSDIQCRVKSENGTICSMGELQNFIPYTPGGCHPHQDFDFSWYDIMT